MDAAFSWNEQRQIFPFSPHICVPRAAIKSKSPYGVAFITSRQPRDHSALQRDSMIARQKTSRAFTPGAVKSARGNINTGERANRRLYHSILLQWFHHSYFASLLRRLLSRTLFTVIIAYALGERDWKG